MSVQSIRKSIFATAAAALILAGGVLAGRMAAGPLSGGRHVSVEKMFNRIADRIDLSASQRDQVKGVLRTHKDAIVAQLQAARTARQDLRQAISASPFDEAAIRGKAAQIGQVEGDGAVLRAQIRSEILPILNDEQKQNLETFHQHMQGTGDQLAASFNEFLSGQGSIQ
jgi:Spy/CpxP family protein refolding chaperone